MVYLALAEHRQFNSPVKQQQQQMCVNLQLEVFFGVMECGSAVPSTEQIIIQLSRQEREEKKKHYYYYCLFFQTHEASKRKPSGNI